MILETSEDKAVQEILGYLKENEVPIFRAIQLLERVKFQLFEFHLHLKGQKVLEEFQQNQEIIRQNGGFKQA